MNKLNQALVALLALGIFVAAEAGCRAKSCGPKRCAKRECAPKCAPEECTTSCEPFYEEKEEMEVVAVQRPVKLRRKCENITRCCTTKKCDKGCWEVVEKGGACVDGEVIKPACE